MAPKASFLGLPLEIRMMIYDCAMRGANKPEDLNLLRVNKQINIEASADAYKRAFWTMPHWPWFTVSDLDQTLQACDRKLIKNVRFVVDNSVAAIGFFPDVTLHGLESNDIKPSRVNFQFDGTRPRHAATFVEWYTTSN